MRTHSLRIALGSTILAASLTVTPSLAVPTQSSAPPEQAQSGTTPAQAPSLPQVPDVAPGYRAPIPVQLPTGDLVGVNQAPFVGITLEDAVAMALSRNTDLAVAQSNERIAGYQIVAARGAYDVRFQLQPQYQHSVSAPLSAFSAGPGGGPITQDVAGATAGLSGELKGGQHFSLTGQQQEYNSNLTLNSYQPYFETALKFNFTQPLGRGTGMTDSRRALQLQLANAKSNRAQALQTASSTITSVATTYWNLVFAWRNLGIQEQGLQQAQAQAQSNARLAKRGSAAPVDIVESQSQVNVFQDNVFSALATVQRLQTQFKQLVVADPGDPIWVANLVPTTPVQDLPAEPKLDDLIVTALRNRPEVAQLEAAEESAATDLGYAKDQLKPQIDLNLGVEEDGFAGVPASGSANPIFSLLGDQTTAINTLLARAGNPLPQISTAGLGTTPAYQNGRYGQAWTNLFNGRYPSYTVGVTFTLPLGNRTAKADYHAAQESAKQVAVREVALLQRIRGESVNAVQQFRETQYRLVAASRAREASERVLTAEQRRFNVGSSTTYLVLQRQLEVANNRGRELQAQTDLNNAVVELNRVSGTLFTAYNVEAQSLGAKTLDAVGSRASSLPAAQTHPPDAHGLK